MHAHHAHRDTYAKFMPTQIVPFYCGGAADGNWLYSEAAQTHRRNREGLGIQFLYRQFLLWTKIAQLTSLWDERSGVLE